MFQTAVLPAPADLLPLVIDAAREGGALLRTEFHRPGGPRGAGGKADVDVQVERRLRARLTALDPCGWLGEETESSGARHDDRWVVDPQDGTSDFLNGRRGAALSIALLRGGRLVLGVVYAPTAPDDAGDLIAWAEGADLTRNGSPVGLSRNAGAAIVAFNADAADFAAHNHARLAPIRVRALPSPAYRLALAAAGEVDAAVSLTRGLAPWDIAGGHALLIGAGGALVQIDGRPVDYGAASFSGCIGGRPEIVRDLVARKITAGRKEQRFPAQPRRRAILPAYLSRAQGCLLGQLAGDALGSAVEFRTSADIAAHHPDGVRDLRDGGTWDLIAGQPTDDSEMALALARSLVAEGRFDPSAVGRAYVAWRHSGPFDIGSTTASGIAALTNGRTADSDSQSNGALMRVSPIGIFAARDPDRAAQLASEDAALTHPHPVCRAASAAYAAAISLGVAGAGPEEMWAGAHAHAGDGRGAEAVRLRLEAARGTAPEDFQHQMGWVLTALQNAFHWLLRGTPLDAALIATVARGGDTDTNAAICGALLGASQGRGAVPLQWRNAILSCRPAPGPGVRHPRPTTYWPDDALDLAEAVLAAGH